MDGTQLPKLISPVPGPHASAWVERLIEVECPAITARRNRRKVVNAGTDPIVWAKARGANVEDVDGNRFVDLSAGFAVAGVGHAHPKVVEAGKQQLETLIHGMGDLFPSDRKIALGERLAQVAPGTLQHSIFGSNGSDAVEAAIKTAMRATGRSRVLGFTDGYHGMSLGALGVSAYRNSFRKPFASMSGAQELRLPYPGVRFRPDGLSDEEWGARCLHMTRWLLSSDTAGSEDVAALILEPIQGRGGDIVPPAGWLKGIRELCNELGILLIFDEIYTGFGRTGRWFACEHEDVVPDLLCVGKAMGGGFPISAVIGTPEVMAGWGASSGESIHTSTFLGNPLGCAMALAAIDVIEQEDLVSRSETLGAYLREGLEARIGDHSRVGPIRGRGLMLGIPLLDEKGAPWAGGGVDAMQGLLQRGIIVSPGGPMGDVISLSPPFVITKEQLDCAIDAISDWILRH